MIRMMIVDDEPLVRVLLRGCIDWAALGIEIVAEAGEAQEALALLAECSPQIICMDVCMPGTSGIELSREILKLSPETHIVVISGHDTFEFAQQCIRLGVDDYLLKPINEEQLIQTMKRVLETLVPQMPVDAPMRESVRQVAAYLREHFQEGELSLQAVADRFYMNASYLSRAFKEDTGKTFVETLTELRMEEAKRLLRETGLAGQSIAEQVGMPDVKYFGACFKKYTGETAKAYRRGFLSKR